MNGRHGLFIIRMIVFFFFLTACAALPQPGDGGHAGQPTTNDANIYRFQRSDGDNNFSRQNPNIRVGDNARSIQNEVRRMEQTAKSVNGVADARAIIAGGHAFVRLHIDSARHQSEAPAIEQEVLNQLAASIPRYEFRVAADGGWLNRIFNR